MFRNTAQRASDEDRMEIQHITYDEARDQVPRLRRRASMASNKVRNYISKRLSRSSDMSQLRPHLEEEEERPPTTWPRLLGPKPKLAEEIPEKTNYLVQKHRIAKTTRKEQIINSSANSSGSYLRLQPPNDKTPSESRGTPLPLSKRKGKFSRMVKEKLNQKSNESGNRESGDRKETAEQMVKIQNLRKAMLEGKLERVIPPTRRVSIGSGRGRRAPPRPVHNPFLENASPAGSIISAREQNQIPSAGTSHSRKRNSGVGGSGNGSKRKKKGNKFVGLIGTSADALDETRREIQGRFRPPFEHLNYPGFGLRKRNSADVDADSDESFFCVGEAEDPSSRPARPKRREEGRLSGERGDRLAALAILKCKLCGLGTVSGIRGLCWECEADIAPPRPKTPAFENEYSASEYEDDVVVEVKPTPPLKDWKPLLIKKQAAVSRNPFEFIDTDSEGERPAVPPKDDIIVSLSVRKNAPKPLISSKGPQRQFPQCAEVEEESEAESVTEKFWRWETGSMTGPEFEDSQRVLRRWSSCFGDEVESREEEEVPLVEARDCEGVARDSEFYKFWDEVLKDHGPRSPGN